MCGVIAHRLIVIPGPRWPASQYLVPGGHDKFGQLESSFEGVSTIGVIGWGSQAPAQSLNIRESLEEAGLTEKIT